MTYFNVIDEGVELASPIFAPRGKIWKKEQTWTLRKGVPLFVALLRSEQISNRQR